MQKSSSHVETIQKTLSKRFFNFDIRIQANRAGNRLICIARRRYPGNRSVRLMTPETVAYKDEAPDYWVKFFASEIK